jgi:hypothetical protein
MLRWQAQRLDAGLTWRRRTYGDPEVFDNTERWWWREMTFLRSASWRRQAQYPPATKYSWCSDADALLPDSELQADAIQLFGGIQSLKDCIVHRR